MSTESGSSEEAFAHESTDTTRVATQMMLDQEVIYCFAKGGGREVQDRLPHMIAQIAQICSDQTCSYLALAQTPTK